jgi:hypothetical protein
MLTIVFSKHHTTLLALQGVGTAVNTHCMLHCNCSDSSLCVQKKIVIEPWNVWGGAQGIDSC